MSEYFWFSLFYILLFFFLDKYYAIQCCELCQLSFQVVLNADIWFFFFFNWLRNYQLEYFDFELKHNCAVLCMCTLLLFIIVQAPTVCLLNGLHCWQRKPKFQTIFNCLPNKVFANTVERLPMTRILHNPGGADLGITDRYYGSRLQPLRFAQFQSKQA